MFNKLDAVEFPNVGVLPVCFVLGYLTNQPQFSIVCTLASLRQLCHKMFKTQVELPGLEHFIASFYIVCKSIEYRQKKTDVDFFYNKMEKVRAKLSRKTRVTKQKQKPSMIYKTCKVVNDFSLDIDQVQILKTRTLERLQITTHLTPSMMTTSHCRQTNLNK